MIFTYLFYRIEACFANSAVYGVLSLLSCLERKERTPYTSPQIYVPLRFAPKCMAFLYLYIAMHLLHEIRHNSYASEGMLQALLVIIIVYATQSNTLYLWVICLNLF